VGGRSAFQPGTRRCGPADSPDTGRCHEAAGHHLDRGGSKAPRFERGQRRRRMEHRGRITRAGDSWTRCLLVQASQRILSVPRMAKRPSSAGFRGRPPQPVTRVGFLRGGVACTPHEGSPPRPPRVSPRWLPIAHRPPVRGPRAAPPARRLPAEPCPAPHQGRRSIALVVAVQDLAWPAECLGLRPADHRHSCKARQTSGGRGGPGSHPQDVDGEPALGLPAHRRGARQAGHSRREVDGRGIHGPAEEAAIADLAGLPPTTT